MRNYDNIYIYLYNIHVDSGQYLSFFFIKCLHILSIQSVFTVVLFTIQTVKSNARLQYSSYYKKQLSVTEIILNSVKMLCSVYCLSSRGCATVKCDNSHCKIGYRKSLAERENNCLRQTNNQ